MSKCSNCILDFSIIILSFQIALSFFNTDVVCSILEIIPFFEPLSSIIKPRYLKVLTSFISSLLLKNTNREVHFTFDITCIFPVLISISLVIKLTSMLLIRLLHVSSENLKIVMALPPIDMLLSVYKICIHSFQSF